jgi:hypothetical protein
MGAFLSRVLAIASRWRCPPDSFTPFSPTIVFMPSGRAWMNSQACAAFAAAITSVSEASARLP